MNWKTARTHSARLAMLLFIKSQGETNFFKCEVNFFIRSRKVILVPNKSKCVTMKWMIVQDFIICQQCWILLSGYCHKVYNVTDKTDSVIYLKWQIHKKISYDYNHNIIINIIIETLKIKFGVIFCSNCLKKRIFLTRIFCKSGKTYR